MLGDGPLIVTKLSAYNQKRVRSHFERIIPITLLREFEACTRQDAPATSLQAAEKSQGRKSKEAQASPCPDGEFVPPLPTLPPPPQPEVSRPEKKHKSNSAARHEAEVQPKDVATSPPLSYEAPRGLADVIQSDAPGRLLRAAQKKKEPRNLSQNNQGQFPGKESVSMPLLLPPPPPHEMPRPKKKHKSNNLTRTKAGGPTKEFAMSPLPSRAPTSPEQKVKANVAVVREASPERIEERTGNDEEDLGQCSVRCMPCDQSRDPRAQLEKALSLLALELRDHPTAPSSMLDPKKPTAVVFQDDSAHLIPPKHCAFKSCLWALEWNALGQADSERDRERALVAHIRGAHKNM